MQPMGSQDVSIAFPDAVPFHAAAVADVCLYLGRILFSNGASTQRVIDSIEHLHRHVEESGEIHVLVTYDAMVLSIVRPDGEFCTKVDRPRQMATVHLARLTAASRYLNGLGERRLDAAQAMTELQALNRTQTGYPLWLILASAAGCGAGFAYLNHVAGLPLAIEALAAVLIFLIRRWLTEREYSLYIATLAAVVLGGLFVGWGMHLAGWGLSVVMIIAPALFLVPGVPIVNGGVDIMRNHNSVGVARLVFGITMTAMLAIGTAGAALLSPHPFQDLAPLRTVWEQQVLYEGLWAAMAAAGLGMIFSAPGRCIPVFAGLALLARAGRGAMAQGGMDLVTATALAVLATTIVSYGLACRMRIPPVVFAVIPVLPIVPGLFAIHGLQELYLFITAGGPPQADHFLAAFHDLGLAGFIIAAIIIGVLLPLLTFDKKGPRL